MHLENRMIRISYIFHEDTYIAASHAMWWRKRQSTRTKYLGLFFLAALPVSLRLAVAKGMHFTFLAVLAVNLLHWVFDWPLTRAIVRRRFAEMPSANRRIDWEIDENGLTVSTDSGESGTFGWEAVREAWESPFGFILAQDHNITHWLPKAAFASEADVERIRELLDRKVRRKAA